MLAGATGIDIALLIVAADEGVMPQTREHLAILGLLGVRGGVIALTKSDLVDEEWLDLVRLDVADTVSQTPLRDAPLVATSVITGAGLDELRARLADVARALVPRQSDDHFRMPVDRAFTVRGTGTVVTGTVWEGSVAREDTVRLMPADRVVRVRGLQMHGTAADRVTAGVRLAVALAGVDHDAVERGALLVGGDGWHPTRVLRADATLLADAGVAALSPRATVRFHLGTSEVGARIVTSGGPLAAGETKAARVVLDAPLVARAGDRFVIRGGTPIATLGGGVIVDPHPTHRRARPWQAPHATPGQRLSLVLAEAGREGLEIAEIPVRVGVRPGDVAALLADAESETIRIGPRLFVKRLRDDMVEAIVSLAERHHVANPLEPGVALQTVRAQLPGRPELSDDAVRFAASAGRIYVDGGVVRKAGFEVRLTDEQLALKTTIVETLRAAGAEPPSIGELEATLGRLVVPIVRILERERAVISVEGDRVYESVALESLVRRLREGMVPTREYSPSELRDVIGLSRKFLIPFLEYCDRQGVTERRSTGRVLHGT